MKTAVVILNWNTRDYLERFLPGLIESCRGLDAEVVVADSASEDGSLQFVHTRFPLVRIIQLEQNFGFTGGYNRALKEIDADNYVLINSDVEVAPDWLKVLDAWMDSHPECGICGPKILSFSNRSAFEYAGAAGGWLDCFGFPYCRGRILHKVEQDKGQYDKPENVLWVSGACLMIRAELWRRLGGFDDRFFAHMEEIDLCWRAQLAGYKVCNVPQSCIYHIGGGTLSNESPFKLKLNYRNNLLLLENNLVQSIGPVRAKIVFGIRKCLDCCAGFVYTVNGKKEYARSVRDAHKEFKELRHGFPDEERTSKKIDGLNKGFIFVKSLVNRDI